MLYYNKKNFIKSVLYYTRIFKCLQSLYRIQQNYFKNILKIKIIVTVILLLLNCANKSQLTWPGYFKIIYRQGLYGFANSTNKVVIKPLYDTVLGFSEGLAAVKERNGGNWGYIDTTGCFVIKPIFSWAESFEKGFAKVRIYNHFKYLSKSKNIYFSRRMCEIQFEEHSNIKWGNISTDGVLSKDTICDSVGCFSGLFACAMRNSNWGVISNDGKWVVNPVFDNIFGIKEGFACAKLHNKSCLIDTKGNQFRQSWYDSCWGFSGGIAKVCENNSCYYISKTNNIYQKVKRLSVGWTDEITAVFVNEKWGVIDSKGQLIIQPIIDSINQLSIRDGYHICYVNSKLGLINNRGNFILQPIYDSISVLNKKYLKYSLDGMQYFTDLKEHKFSALLKIPPLSTVNIFKKPLSTNIDDKESDASEIELAAGSYLLVLTFKESGSVFHETYTCCMIQSSYEIEIPDGRISYFDFEDKMIGERGGQRIPPKNIDTIDCWTESISDEVNMFFH